MARSATGLFATAGWAGLTGAVLWRLYGPRPATATVAVRWLAERGGSVSEDDPELTRAILRGLTAAEKQGLVSGGGGWSAGYSLTERGRAAAGV